MFFQSNVIPFSVFQGKNAQFDQITGNLLILLKLLENTNSITWMLYRSACLFNISWIFIKSLVIKEFHERYQFFHSNAVPFDVFTWKITGIFKIIRIWWKIYHFEALFTTNAMKLIFFNIIKVKNPCFSKFSVHLVQFSIDCFSQTGCYLFDQTSELLHWKFYYSVCKCPIWPLSIFYIEMLLVPK